MSTPEPPAGDSDPLTAQGKKARSTRKTGPSQKAREDFGWFWKAQDPRAAPRIVQRKPTQAVKARARFLKVRTTANFVAVSIVLNGIGNKTLGPQAIANLEPLLNAPPELVKMHEQQQSRGGQPQPMNLDANERVCFALTTLPIAVIPHACSYSSQRMTGLS
jgi:hypothetical protein